MNIDYKFWLPFVLTFVNLGIGVVQTRLQMKSIGNSSTDAALRVNRADWYKTYWPVFAMVLTVILCWVPYFLPADVPAIPVVLQWGRTEKTCYTNVDTSRLTKFTDKFSIVLACGVVDPTIDLNEDKRIVLSGPFGISGGAQVMAASFTPEFTTYLNSFGVGVQISMWQALFLVPRGTDLSRIHELSDVPSFGGMLFKSR